MEQGDRNGRGDKRTAHSPLGVGFHSSDGGQRRWQAAWPLVFPVLLAIALIGLLGAAAPASAMVGDSGIAVQDSNAVVNPCAEKHHNGPVSAEVAAEEAAACAAQPVPPEPPPTPLSCDGTVLCMATEDEARAAGLDVDTMRRNDQQALATVLAQREADLKQSGMTSTLSSYYSAWVNFYLYQSSAGYCSGTVNHNNHCGWLYHRYYDDASGWLYTTSFPARSGSNIPANDWSYGGPIPNDHQPAGGSVTNHYKWGFMNGTYYGYQSDSSATFDPGKWRLDPWYVNEPGTGAPPYERSEFEIHGGSGNHDFWVSGTYGCIRLPKASITSLKSLWDNRTSNKQMGAYVYVYYP